MATSGQEKTEEPTSKKLEDTRKKGQVARSRDLATFTSPTAHREAETAKAHRG